MDSAEGVSLAKMAVTVLLVVLVIGAVVAVVYMAYSWFTSGTDKLGDTVNSLDSSSYSQYDDSQCSGVDVLTALKSYRDSDVAIVICNGKKGESGVANSAYTPGASTAVGFNYCGCVTEAYDTAKKAIKDVPQITVEYKNNRWQVNSMYWDESTGLTARNTNFSPTTNKGKAETYVRQNAEFYSNLIYDDSTGEVCGILFRIMGVSESPAADPAP